MNYYSASLLISFTDITTIHFIFFFNDTATTEIYTLSLHDALPISPCVSVFPDDDPLDSTGTDRHGSQGVGSNGGGRQDRKSTRLNSSHQIISYAVFCLKKKN